MLYAMHSSTNGRTRMLQRIRNRVRIFFLWLYNEYKIAQDLCSWCGRRGIEATSIAYPARLCKACGLMAQDAAMNGYVIADVSVVFPKVGDTILPGMYYFDLSNLKPKDLPEGTQPIVDDFEFPCFDTYPSPLPKDVRR